MTYAPDLVTGLSATAAKNGRCTSMTEQELGAYPPLDVGIRDAVLVLSDAGVTTFESREGGLGHAQLSARGL